MSQHKLRDTSLFVWRDHAVVNPWRESPENYLHREYGTIYNNIYSQCPFCHTVYNRPNSEDYICPLCGFNLTYNRAESPLSGGFEDFVYISLLRKLDISSAELGLDELGSHLRRRFRDIYNLEPHRLEELVADVYGQLGFKSRLTKQTRDRGYDIILFEESSGRQILVECKRYKRERKVVITAVRNLLGVQLYEGVSDAKLVTTSGFTAPAKKMIEKAGGQVGGFSLELVDADRLLRLLDVYNSRLPPLDVALRMRRDIIGKSDL